jgi:hypothetical protein
LRKRKPGQTPGLIKNKKAAGFAAGGFFSIAAQKRCGID